MSTRYQQLRQSVATLAEPAGEQALYLDLLHAPLTGGGSAIDYGNDELALELGETFIVANDLIEHGELTEAEAAAIRPLDELLTKWSGRENADFWRREALFDDRHWTKIRILAAQALTHLPDEKRTVGRSA